MAAVEIISQDGRLRSGERRAMIRYETVREQAIQTLLAACGGHEHPQDLRDLIAAFLSDAYDFGQRDARLEILISSRCEAPQ
jgi:hypothetical protein